MRDSFDLEPKGKTGKVARAKRPAKGGDAARLAAFVRGFSEGKLDARLDPRTFADAGLRSIALAVNAAADHVIGRMKDAEARMSAVGAGVDEAIDAMVRLVIQGDLSGSLRIGVSDAALTPLIAGVGQVMETLKRFVTEIREAALQLSTSSAEVLAAATQNESSTSAQASAIHETTATMEELKGASHQIAENAQMVAAIAEQTLTGARNGEERPELVGVHRGAADENAVGVFLIDRHREIGVEHLETFRGNGIEHFDSVCHTASHAWSCVRSCARGSN